MELEGPDAVKHLRGPNSVRDGCLVNLSVDQVHKDPTVELTFEIPRDGEIRVVTLQLKGVQEFDYSYTIENPPNVVAFVKCLMTSDGEFYLSLDPWDEAENFISDKDNEFFRSKLVRLTETRKSSIAQSTTAS